MQDFASSNVKATRQSARLLILDDNAHLRASLRQQFLVEGFYNIFDTGSSIGLETVLKEANPDLILLDIQMIGDNSLDICRHLRSQGFAKSILMLASKNAELDIISCLEAGANDYIIKPLRMNELLVRIEAQLWEFRTSNDTQLALANLSFDPTNKMLQKNGGHCMETLTEKETIILQFLYHSFPGSVTKEDILLEVWGLQDGLTTHTLETHIYRLRQKISRLTEASLIITKENGYCLAL